MAQEHNHSQRPLSPRLAFLLTNPLRRRLDPPNRLLEQVGIGLEDTVVDFGCGPGYYTVEIARRAKRTIGVDLSEEMLQKACRRAAKGGVTVEFLKSDGTSIELASSSVDLILLVHVFHEVPSKNLVLAEFRRILRGNCRVVILERTADSFLSHITPGPPVVDVSAIKDMASTMGLPVSKIESYHNDSKSTILTLQKPS